MNQTTSSGQVRQSLLNPNAPAFVPGASQTEINRQYGAPQPTASSKSTPVESASRVTVATTRRTTAKTAPQVAKALRNKALRSAPIPTQVYLDQASIEPFTVEPRTLLIVLDLNGTLCQRGKAGEVTSTRPYLDDFLQYCLKQHRVMIWSSARTENTQRATQALFSKAQRDQLVGQWGRETLGLSQQAFLEKVQVYKRLDFLWASSVVQSSHPDFQDGGGWDQTNTILIDDSEKKAVSEPWNHVEVPEYTRAGRHQIETRTMTLRTLVGYIEKARRASDVSAFIKRHRLAIDGPFVSEERT